MNTQKNKFSHTDLLKVSLSILVTYLFYTTYYITPTFEEKSTLNKSNKFNFYLYGMEFELTSLIDFPLNAHNLPTICEY